MEWILTITALLLIYAFWVMRVSRETINKISALSKRANDHEIRLLQLMILFFPIFFHEIDTIIKHMEDA